MDRFAVCAEENAFAPDLCYILHTAGGPGVGASLFCLPSGLSLAETLRRAYAKIYKNPIRMGPPPCRYTELYRGAAPAVWDEIAHHETEHPFIHRHMRRIARNKTNAILQYLKKE
jgi:hypothetical protein